MSPDAPPPPKPRRPRLRRGQKVWVAHGGRAAERATVVGPSRRRDAVSLTYDDDRRPGRVWGAYRRLVFICLEDALNYAGP